MVNYVKCVVIQTVYVKKEHCSAACVADNIFDLGWILGNRALPYPTHYFAGERQRTGARDTIGLCESAENPSINSPKVAMDG